MYLLRVLFLFLVFIFFMGCGKKFIVEDSKELYGDMGIALMLFVYKEGFPTYESMTFTIESLDRSFFTKIQIDKNTKQMLTFELKEGKYFFSDVYAIADTSYATASSKEDMPVFYGYIAENVFDIKARSINYIGDILVQTKRERIGKRFSLFSDSGFRENSYFFSSLLDSTRNIFKRRYPSLSSRYALINSSIFYGVESVNIKEAYYKESASSIYGYGGQAYGKDLPGYRDYEWGMEFDELQLALREGGREHSFIDDFTVEAKLSGKRIEFYFSRSDRFSWKNRLYKVLVYSDTGMDKEIDSISQKHGFPNRSGSEYVWDLPSTRITLSKGSKKILVIYESRRYIKDVL